MDTQIPFLAEGELAEKQRNIIAHDLWLTEQVNAAFSKIESGQSEFISHKDANLHMKARKANIRDKASQ